VPVAVADLDAIKTPHHRDRGQGQAPSPITPGVAVCWDRPETPDARASWGFGSRPVGRFPVSSVRPQVSDLPGVLPAGKTLLTLGKR
jgi:hypothetical protein